MKSNIRELVKLARAVGATVTPARSGHVQIVGAGWRVVASSTPSCPHWLANVQRDVRRAVSKGGATC